MGGWEVSLGGVHKPGPCKGLAILDGYADNVAMTIKGMGQLLTTQAVRAWSVPAPCNSIAQQLLLLSVTQQSSPQA